MNSKQKVQLVDYTTKVRWNMISSLKIARIKVAKRVFQLNLTSAKKWVEDHFEDYGRGAPILEDGQTVMLTLSDADEIKSLLSFWYEHDDNLNELIMEAAREVAAVAKMVLVEELGIKGDVNVFGKPGFHIPNKVETTNTQEIQDLLRELEWGDSDPNAFALMEGGGFTAHRCPICNRSKEISGFHDSTCTLAAMLHKLENL